LVQGEVALIRKAQAGSWNKAVQTRRATLGLQVFDLIVEEQEQDDRLWYSFFAKFGPAHGHGGGGESFVLGLPGRQEQVEVSEDDRQKFVGAGRVRVSRTNGAEHGQSSFALPWDERGAKTSIKKRSIQTFPQ